MNKRIKKKVLKRRLTTGWTPPVIRPKDTVLHLMKPFHPGNFIWATPIVTIGTIIETRDGRNQIENIRPGDEVTSPSGRHYKVQEVISMTKVLEDTE